MCERQAHRTILLNQRTMIRAAKICSMPIESLTATLAQATRKPGLRRPASTTDEAILRASNTPFGR
jgi:hypothetical protein